MATSKKFFKLIHAFQIQSFRIIKFFFLSPSQSKYFHNILVCFRFIFKMYWRFEIIIIQYAWFGHNNTYTLVEFRLCTYNDAMFKELEPTITTTTKIKNNKCIFIALKTHKTIQVSFRVIDGPILQYLCTYSICLVGITKKNTNSNRQIFISKMLQNRKKKK